MPSKKMRMARAVPRLAARSRVIERSTKWRLMSSFASKLTVQRAGPRQKTKVKSSVDSRHGDVEDDGSTKPRGCQPDASISFAGRAEL